MSEPSQGAKLPDVVKDALVMDLRRRWSTAKRVVRKGVSVVPGINIREREPSSSSRGVDLDDAARAWRGGSEPSPIENDMRGIFSDDDDEEREEGSPGMTRYST